MLIYWELGLFDVRFWGHNDEMYFMMDILGAESPFWRSSGWNKKMRKTSNLHTNTSMSLLLQRGYGGVSRIKHQIPGGKASGASTAKWFNILTESMTS